MTRRAATEGGVLYARGGGGGSVQIGRGGPHMTRKVAEGVCRRLWRVCGDTQDSGGRWQQRDYAARKRQRVHS